MRPAPSLALLGAVVLHGIFLLGPWFTPQTSEPETPALRVKARLAVPEPVVPPAEPTPAPKVANSEALAPVAPNPVAASAFVSAGAVGEPPAGPAPEEAPAPAPSMDPEVYRRLVREAVAEQKKYPYAARVRGQQGTAVVRFSLDPSGALLTPPQIARSSGVVRLDEAARAAVTAAAPYLPPPPGFEASFDLPVEFVLNSSP